MVALAVVGAAVGAASTIASISEQQRQAKLQSQALADQMLLSQDRLTIARENREFAKKWAEVQATQEQLVLLAQRDQALQDIEYQALQAQMAATQARMEKAGLQTNLAQMNAEMLAQIASIQSEANIANTNKLEESENIARTGQRNQVARQMAAVRMGTGEPGSLTQVAKDELEVQKIATLQQRIEEDVRNTEAQAELATRAMEDARRINKDLGEISLEAAESNIKAQEASTALSLPYARSNLESIVRRNQEAIRAQQFSNAAAQDARYLAQVAEENTNQLALRAQQRQIYRPGFLSYLSAGLGFGLQAYQAGLFNRPAPAPQQPQSGLISRQNTNPPYYYRYVDVTGNIYG